MKPALLLLVPALLLLAPAAGGAAAPATAPAPVVIAVMGENSINPLHQDFRTANGKDPRLPAGLTVTWVDLPRAGSFSERIEELRRGPLGRMAVGVVYAVRGTRLLLVNPPLPRATRPPKDALGEPEPVCLSLPQYCGPFHGTGVAAAAGGVKHGTDPQSLVLMVFGFDHGTWDWVAARPWVELTSSSVVRPVSCDGVEGLVAIRQRGGLSFAATGDGEQAALVSFPSSHPDAYQVGGVDADGRTTMPGHASSTPLFRALSSGRPYETGELFDFPSADGNSETGSVGFGGTSGSTARMAGRAAQLVREARRILRSPYGGTRDGALAVAGRGAAVPAKGPLADGRFTRTELADVLHRSATPMEQATPARYVVEGYGATNAASQQRAFAALAGRSDLPQRTAEDEADAKATAFYAAVFGAQRCAVTPADRKRS